mgnify:CR=1 FL=1
MARVYNFSAGPAVLPEEVLKEAADGKVFEKILRIRHLVLAEMWLALTLQRKK